MKAEKELKWEKLMQNIKRPKNGYLSASQRTDTEPLLITYEEADQLYNLSEAGYFLDGNEEVVLVLKEDTIITGDIFPERDGILSGIIALKNLTVKGSIDGEWGREWIYVMGNLTADNIIIGDGFIDVKGNVQANHLILHDCCEGGLYGSGTISAAATIASVPGLITGKITGGTVIDISGANGAQGTFDTQLPIHYENELDQFILPEFYDANEDEDDDEEQETIYDIRKKEIVKQLLVGNPILKGY